ncbi:hypothetical protein MSAN_01957800 [Mycena sanguinolenta]|uniref:F-box domain-containing protein n=1 Tax=Mycena sanguinolenta TaxID=230812 RepID=A0A8H6XLC4_9AGAR|nr:hypothetical protein MSAN_01957800 [Mycena sanguinolenta]
MSTSLSSLIRRRMLTRVNPRQRAKIPPEIEFLIIDYFEDDNIHLLSFYRVSRAWASHAQILLFRNVCVCGRGTSRPSSRLSERGRTSDDTSSP